jgi:hypothetical protein
LSATNTSTSKGVAGPDPSSVMGANSNSANKRVARSRSMDSAPGSSSKTVSSSQRAAPPSTYYVGNGNGWRFIKAALDRRGWQQLPFEYSFSTRFSLKWVERRSQIDFATHSKGQVRNICSVCIMYTIDSTIVR